MLFVMVEPPNAGINTVESTGWRAVARTSGSTDVAVGSFLLGDYVEHEGAKDSGPPDGRSYVFCVDDLYHEDRTHLGLGKDTPNGRVDTSPLPKHKILSLPRLGGLVRSRNSSNTVRPRGIWTEFPLPSVGSPSTGIHNLRPEQNLHKHTEHPRDHDQFPSA